MLPSEATQSFASALALDPAAQTAHFAPATLVDGMLNVIFAMPPPNGDALLSEQNRFAHIANMQSMISNAYRTATVDQALANVEEYYRRGGQDQHLAALRLFGDRMRR